MSPPTIDTASWPYVEIDYQPSMTSADLEQYGEALNTLYARGALSPCVLVIDTRNAPAERATLSVRRDLVGMINMIHKRYPGAVLAEAVILEGQLAPSLYMAYTWLLRDKNMARRAFRDKEEATAWAKTFLRHASDIKPNVA